MAPQSVSEKVRPKKSYVFRPLVRKITVFIKGCLKRKLNKLIDIFSVTRTKVTIDAATSTSEDRSSSK
jgi:hypothetical protein